MDIEYDNISDFDLQGLVDGAFDNETHNKLMEIVKKKPVMWRRLEDLFQQKYILKEWWRLQPVT